MAQSAMDRLSLLEKTAVGMNMASQALIVARWYAGATLQQTIGATAISWLITAFALAAGLSLDLAVVVTTISRREGRRSWWGHAAAGSATAFSALIALDVYGGPTPGPWLHVANALTTFCLIQHLATPRNADAPERVREVAAAWKAKADELAGTVASLRAALEARQPAPAEPHPVAPAPEIAPVAPQAVRVAEVVEPQTEPAHRTGVLKLERTKADTWDRIIAGLGAGEPLVQIAGALGISEAMVRKHRDAMLAEGVLVRDGRDYRKNGVALEVV